MSQVLNKPNARTRNAIQVDGRLLTPATTQVDAKFLDENGYIMLARGATLPSAEAGYAVGCVFTKLTAVAGATVYINEGTALSCSFKAIKTPDSDPSFSGNVTIGDSTADTLVLMGRRATGSVAGAAIDFATAYTYGEAVEERFRVTNWTGIGTQFQGYYVRTETNIDISGGTLRGAEWAAVANAAGVDNLEGLLAYAYIKGDTTETFVNLYGLHGEFTMDAGRANTATITEVGGVLSKILSGKVDDYTKIHGFIGRFGDMDGGSRKYGSGLRLLEGVEAGTSSLSNVIYTDMAADYFLQVSADVKGAVDATIAGQTVGTINTVVKCRFASTDFYLYGYAGKPTV